MQRPIHQRNPLLARYAMTARNRDGHLLGRVELDHTPTETERVAYLANFPLSQTRLDWTTVSVEVLLP